MKYMTWEERKVFPYYLQMKYDHFYTSWHEEQFLFCEFCRRKNRSDLKIQAEHEVVGR